MLANNGKNRRRNLMSLPAAQARIIGLLLILGLLYAALNVYISRRALEAMAAEAYQIEMSALARHDLRVVVAEQFATLDLQLAIFLLLSFVMVGLVGVLLSHRLGGPVFHLQQYLNAVADGRAEPGPVRFRKGDFFHDLAAAFNRFQRARGLLPPEAPPEATPPPVS